MAICLVKRGGNGADPDEITARANDVVQGKTTIDSEGETVEGIIPLKSVDTDLPNVALAYTRADAWKTGGVVDSPRHGRGIITALKPNGQKMALDEQADFVFKPEPDLKPENVLSTAKIATMQGGIAVSKTIINHVKDMPQGSAWSDEHGVRYYVIKIDENVYIPEVSKGGYAYVGKKEPGLFESNIRAGIRIGDITGTMIDYGAGKVAFNGATFDGLLLSGVAGMNNRNNSFGINDGAKSYQYRGEHSVNEFRPQAWSRECRTPGISNGGLYIYNEKRYDKYDAKDADDQFLAGYIFSHTVNLSPFKTIRVGFKVLDIWANTYNDSNNGKPWIVSIFRAAMSVVRADTLQGINSNRLNQAGIGGARAAEYYNAIESVKRQELGKQLWFDMNVSDLHGHHYICIGAGTEKMYSSWVSVVFNHIEFIN